MRRAMEHKLKPGFVTAMLLTTALASGCVGLGSTTLPPELSSQEREKVREAHLPFIVGVERYQYPAYSDALVSALQKLRLFDRVDFRDRLSIAPSLVVEVEQAVYGNPAIPFATLLSFGIIPTTVPETHGYVFSFHSPRNENPKEVIEGISFRSLKDENQKVVVDFRYRAQSTLGWVAGFRALSSDEVMFCLESHRRFRDAFTLAILAQSDALTRLAQQATK